jgi:hypothetical protein
VDQENVGLARGVSLTSHNMKLLPIEHRLRDEGWFAIDEMPLFTAAVYRGTKCDEPWERKGKCGIPRTRAHALLSRHLALYAPLPWPIRTL